MKFQPRPFQKSVNTEDGQFRASQLNNYVSELSGKLCSFQVMILPVIYVFLQGRNKDYNLPIYLEIGNFVTVYTDGGINKTHLNRYKQGLFVQSLLYTKGVGQKLLVLAVTQRHAGEWESFIVEKREVIIVYG